MKKAMKRMTATPPAAMPMMAPNERGTVLKNKASFKQHMFQYLYKLTYVQHLEVET